MGRALRLEYRRAQDVWRELTARGLGCPRLQPVPPALGGRTCHPLELPCAPSVDGGNTRQPLEHSLLVSVQIAPWERTAWGVECRPVLSALQGRSCHTHKLISASSVRRGPIRLLLAQRIVQSVWQEPTRLALGQWSATPAQLESIALDLAPHVPPVQPEPMGLLGRPCVRLVLLESTLAL
jgi:hypothetical protein